MDDKKFNEYVAKGKKLYQELKDAITAGTADRVDGDKAYPARYISSDKDDVNAPSNLQDTMKKLSLPTTGYREQKTKVKEAKEDAYDNYYLPTNGVIVASWNYANKDIGGTGTRLTLSEILWLY